PHGRVVLARSEIDIVRHSHNMLSILQLSGDPLFIDALGRYAVSPFQDTLEELREAAGVNRDGA
ncbi:MAG: hypothetical protein M3495_20235, partial [Pseudomonadota bacterium]|nr:hypothetical protein [Pseudomonadota bacterium]